MWKPILKIRKNLSTLIRANFENPEKIKSNAFAKFAKIMIGRETDADLAKTIIKNYNNKSTNLLTSTGFPLPNRGGRGSR